MPNKQKLIEEYEAKLAQKQREIAEQNKAHQRVVNKLKAECDDFDLHVKALKKYKE